MATSAGTFSRKRAASAGVSSRLPWPGRASSSPASTTSVGASAARCAIWVAVRSASSGSPATTTTAPGRSRDRTGSVEAPHELGQGHRGVRVVETGEQTGRHAELEERGDVGPRPVRAPRARRAAPAVRGLGGPRAAGSAASSGSACTAVLVARPCPAVVGIGRRGRAEGRPPGGPGAPRPEVEAPGAPSAAVPTRSASTRGRRRRSPPRWRPRGPGRARRTARWSSPPSAASAAASRASRPTASTTSPAALTDSPAGRVRARPSRGRGGSGTSTVSS